MTPSTSAPPSCLIVGAGPAGLMAAESLAQGGATVNVYDAMPSVGRKFLLAGIGGLNITHSESLASFTGRYAQRADVVGRWLNALNPAALREWVHGLGIATFVGSSGRVFPSDMKAAPLLRAWLHRLRASGVRFHMRHRWLGWDDSGACRFATPDGERVVGCDALVLAAGGASWPRLGSDGAWASLLQQRGVEIALLRPSNCGFDIGATAMHPEAPGWSAHFRERHAGHPIKPVLLRFARSDGRLFERQGEFVITDSGVEGSLIYAVSALMRDEIQAHGFADFTLDLLPDRDAAFVAAEVARPRGPRSMSTHLKSRLGIEGVKAGLLHEVLTKEEYADVHRLATALKALPLRVVAPRPIEEAISTAGGVRLEALNHDLMLHALPGVFCAGEMLDWEAPTGGYLLTASLASGRVAGQGALAWLRASPLWQTRALPMQP